MVRKACFLLLALLGFSAGCGGGDDESTSTGHTTHTTTITTDSYQAPGHPPPPPANAPPGDGAGSVTFAITRLRFGDTPPDSSTSVPGAWTDYGYDLDGKVSTEASTDLCQPRNGSPPKFVYPDGDDGIDNSFGRNILPIMLGLSEHTPRMANDRIAQGWLTLLIDIAGLGSGSNYAPLVAKVYDGGDLGHAPKLDGTDVWPRAADALADPNDPGSALAVFPMSYLTGNTWVGQAQGELRLRLSFVGDFSTGMGAVLSVTIEVMFPILNPTVSMELDPTHTKATHGVIAGVIPTERMADAMRSAMAQLAAEVDPGICHGATVDSVVEQTIQASDILADATQDPAKTCDAISIGIGFDAAVVQLGPVQPMKPRLPPCCTDQTCAVSIEPSSSSIPCSGNAQMAYGKLFHCACDLACASVCAGSICLGKGPSPACTTCLHGACGAELQACMSN